MLLGRSEEGGRSTDRRPGRAEEIRARALEGVNGQEGVEVRETPEVERVKGGQYWQGQTRADTAAGKAGTGWRTGLGRGGQETEKSGY